MKRRIMYAEFETLVIELYERKELSQNLLDRVASRYRLVGMDSAGSRYLRARDGKDLYQICIELVDPNFPIFPRGSSEDHDDYWEQELKKWEEIVYQRWNWQAYCTAFPIQNQRDNAA